MYSGIKHEVSPLTYRRRGLVLVLMDGTVALHYDLRIQLDGLTVSWAIPKGLLGESLCVLPVDFMKESGLGTDNAGISKRGESSRLAVETTLHPISYTVFEGEHRVRG